MRASEVFERAHPGGVCIVDCLNEIDRLAGQAAQLREALAGVTKESDGLRAALGALVCAVEAVEDCTGQQHIDVSTEDTYLVAGNIGNATLQQARQALKGGAS